MNESMKLKRQLPPLRTYEQVLNHYLVEKEIADRLKQSTRENRRRILEVMYDELFEKVPDHPRLTRKQDDDLTARANDVKFSLVKPFLRPSDQFLEFGSGDCRFAMRIADMVQTVYAVDISDQRNVNDAVPANFKLVVYDGSELSGVPAESIDLIFSDQLIEHLHPEDTRSHFELAWELLKPGGRYVFRTPHAFTGPHDVSKYFSDVAECFHLKEWTYRELRVLLRELTFRQMLCYRLVKGRCIRIPFAFIWSAEILLRHLPRSYSRTLSDVLIPAVYAVGRK